MPSSSEDTPVASDEELLKIVDALWLAIKPLLDAKPKKEKKPPKRLESGDKKNVLPDFSGITDTVHDV